MKQAAKQVLIGLGQFVLYNVVFIIVALVMAVVAAFAVSMVPVDVRAMNLWFVALTIATYLIGCMVFATWVLGLVLGWFSKTYSMVSFRTLYVMMAVSAVVNIVAMGSPWYSALSTLFNILMIVTIVQEKFSPMEIELRKGE